MEIVYPHLNEFIWPCFACGWRLTYYDDMTAGPIHRQKWCSLIRGCGCLHKLTESTFSFSSHSDALKPGRVLTGPDCMGLVSTPSGGAFPSTVGVSWLQMHLNAELSPPSIVSYNKIIESHYSLKVYLSQQPTKDGERNVTKKA